MVMPEKQPTLRRWLPMLAAFGFFALFYVALFAGDPTRLPSALTGQMAPDFDLLGLETGSAGLRRSDLATGRPVVLNVWASWCGPCREEHPQLMALAREGVTVFGLNYKDDTQAARRFIGSLDNPYARIGADTRGRVAIDFGVYGVPETFVIDGTGRIVSRFAGPLDRASLELEILPHLELPEASQ
jgi:cytochrome c biogenesis protein CcmG/thiol:disulfide interchange protein DsbE